MHWMISDCYVKLKTAGHIPPEKADPIIEWGYQTLFEQYPHTPDVRYAAIRLAEINLARGKPVGTLVYINWLLDNIPNERKRSEIISFILGQLEEPVQ